ncbi:MAG: hypothetical protein CFE29_04400 [Bradyrhizobiaceae bacterium PARB1]|jgi:hypothetical protein|nr:MAG: hypothetical protein CFE29_04400 [Bradyrhizobiaceae bacterium PARB1]
MSIEEVAVELPAAEAPPLVTEAFGNRAVFEMELALQKACQILPPELDSHEHRCFIARSILARVGGGERTFAGMVSAGMAAVEQLRQRQEQV